MGQSFILRKLSSPYERGTALAREMARYVDRTQQDLKNAHTHSLRAHGADPSFWGDFVVVLPGMPNGMMPTQVENHLLCTFLGLDGYRFASLIARDRISGHKSDVTVIDPRSVVLNLRVDDGMDAVYSPRYFNPYEFWLNHHRWLVANPTWGFSGSIEGYEAFAGQDIHWLEPNDH